ncbi:hypothetical protein EJB05_44411, partial [Eragrostis curvula]
MLLYNFVLVKRSGAVSASSQGAWREDTSGPWRRLRFHQARKRKRPKPHLGNSLNLVGLPDPSAAVPSIACCPKASSIPAVVRQQASGSGRTIEVGSDQYYDWVGAVH